MLFPLSFNIELSALLMAIWLGLYLVTRSFHRPAAWLAALTAWSMGGLFLNMLFALMPPSIPAENNPWLKVLLLFWPRGILEQNPSAWLQGWAATLSPVFWFHATLLLRSERLTKKRIAFLIGGYLLGAAGILIQARLPKVYNQVTGDPLMLNSLHGSPLYAGFLLVLLLLCLLSIRNLILAAQVEPRSLPKHRLLLLSAATALAMLTAPLGLVAAFFSIPVPMFLIALLIGAGLLVTSYGVAQYNALMETRVFFMEFCYSAMVVAMATLFCLACTWTVSRLIQIPQYLYVLTGLLAVSSYTLVDIARQVHDLHIYQHEKRLLRERLHILVSQKEDNLQRRLQTSLETICTPLQASYGVLLASRGGTYEQIAIYQWKQDPVSLPAAMLAADDLKLLEPGELPGALAEAAVLIPIYMGEQQVGALVLGAAEHGLEYSSVELEEPLEYNDYLASQLSYLILNRSLLQEHGESKYIPDHRNFSSRSNEISPRTVELGLRSLYDYPKLAELPLARLKQVHRRLGINPSHIETGEAVHNLLCEALERLRPGDESEAHRIQGAPRRDWYPYIVLRDAYRDCLPNREIMARLYISEGTFNRTRRSAIQSLTRLLAEMDQS